MIKIIRIYDEPAPPDPEVLAKAFRQTTPTIANSSSDFSFFQPKITGTHYARPQSGKQRAKAKSRKRMAAKSKRRNRR